MITGLDMPDPSYAAETVIAVSLLMLVVLSIRKYIARQFGAGVAYALWLFPVARLVLPPLPSPMSLMSFLGRGSVPSAQAGPAPEAAILTGRSTQTVVHGADGTTAVSFSVPSASEAPHSVTLADAMPATVMGPEASDPMIGGLVVSALLVLWAGGAVFMFGRSFLAHHSFMQTVRREAGPVSPELARMAEQVARQVGLKRMPRIASSFISAGPLVTGLFRPTVLLPAWFEEDYDRIQQRAALAHELTHVKRGDLWALQVSECVLALLWFNPLAYYARRAFRTDQEAACDSDVLKCGAASPHEYGQTLLRAVQITLPERLTAAASLPLTHALKERMLRMTNPAPSRSRRLMGASMAGLLGSVALMATASVTANAEEGDSHGIRITNGTVYIDGEEVKDRQIVILGDPFGAYLPSPDVQLEIDELSKKIKLETQGLEAILENMPVVEMEFESLGEDLAGGMAFAFSFEDGKIPATEEEWEAWVESIEARGEDFAARADEWSAELDARFANWELEFEPQMEAFEARIDALASQIDEKVNLHFGEEFEARIEMTHDMVEDLALECRDASLAEGETRILERRTDGGKSIKIACVKGGPDALRAESTITAIQSNKNLCEKEKASFMSRIEGSHDLEIEFDQD